MKSFALVECPSTDRWYIDVAESCSTKQMKLEKLYGVTYPDKKTNHTYPSSCEYYFGIFNFAQFTGDSVVVRKWERSHWEQDTLSEKGQQQRDMRVEMANTSEQ